MFNQLLSSVELGKMVDIVTVIDGIPDCDIGKMLIIYEDGRVEGEFDDLMTQHILDKLGIMSWTKPENFSIEDQRSRTYRLLWEKIAGGRNAVVFGGGHVSQPLVQMLSLLDFSVTVVDDRPEFANQGRFPSAQKVICDSFHQSFEQLSIGADTAVIIVTRGHRYDMECLRATMDSNARYLGMIGSKRRIREVLHLLREEGAPAGLEKRLKAPIGFNIKAETPAEIAVSIVAEVVATFRGSISGLSLSENREVF